MRRQASIENQALDWLVKRQRPEWASDDQDDLDAWLNESIAHKAAFWRAEYGWQQTDRLQSLGLKTGLVAARSQARFRWIHFAAAASLVAFLAIGGFASRPDLANQPHTIVQQVQHQTAIGGREEFELPDGSRVELNTSTTVRAAVSEARREVWLDSGEAFFDVVHDPDRPFIVHAGGKTITVLGTKFSVRRDESHTIVSVLEGRVRIDELAGPSHKVTIVEDGGTAYSRNSSILLAAKSAKRVRNSLAWREGELSFEQAPLSEVVSEFNRYNETKLLVSDNNAANILIGGSFKTSSTDSFVRLLRDAYGLNIQREGDTVRISTY
tara:strand:+ start:1405 stop:2379 length:975 start_codon:yes stop_codon:yes gene_type:complete